MDTLEPPCLNLKLSREVGRSRVGFVRHEKITQSNISDCHVADSGHREPIQRNITERAATGPDILDDYTQHGSQMLYNGFINDLAARFQRQFDGIRATFNFDYGDEFEISIATTLRQLLPSRFGVCRGFVVAQSGERAGDDIIVYDKWRFPSLRSLGDELGRKESVPAEAVVAYIEAKHTLYLDGTNPSSLQKALTQLSAVKSLFREPVHNSSLSPKAISAGIFVFNQDTPGAPDRRNPWYGAIWARNIDLGNPERNIQREVYQQISERSLRPDFVVGGRKLAFPIQNKEDKIHMSPFSTPSSELCSAESDVAFGIAVAHLLWAVESIQLGEMPWGQMLSEALGH